MPITVNRDEILPQTIHWHYQGRWTWDEFHAAFERAYQLLGSDVNERWDIISVQFDFTLPPGDAIKHAHSEFRRTMEKNVGLMVCITDSPLFTILSKMGLALFPQYREILRVTNSVDSGYQLIMQDRARLRVTSESEN